MGGGTEKPLEVVFAGDALGTAMRVVQGMPRFGNGWSSTARPSPEIFLRALRGR